jgi:hypothetical protein
MRQPPPGARVLRTPRDDPAPRQVPNSKLGGHALDTAAFATGDELLVRTVRGDGSWATRPIWFVIVDGQVYVRSAYGQHGAWYQIARRDGAVDVQVNDVVIRARLEPMYEKDRNARISVAYERTSMAWAHADHAQRRRVRNHDVAYPVSPGNGPSSRRRSGRHAGSAERTPVTLLLTLATSIRTAFRPCLRVLINAAPG